MRTVGAELRGVLEATRPAEAVDGRPVLAVFGELGVGLVAPTAEHAVVPLQDFGVLGHDVGRLLHQIRFFEHRHGLVDRGDPGLGEGVENLWWEVGRDRVGPVEGQLDRVGGHEAFTEGKEAAVPGEQPVWAAGEFAVEEAPDGRGGGHVVGLTSGLGRLCGFIGALTTVGAAVGGIAVVADCRPRIVGCNIEIVATVAEGHDADRAAHHQRKGHEDGG